mmetsp:Transcript_7519/g.15901  ORF Transcript_7519/g.15901 Transcript_7519/m.15901 type:complete len:206 (-) Transcript_7519:403-1020(-)
MLLEGRILEQREIGDEHDGATLTLELRVALFRLVVSPLLCQHVLEVAVVELQGCLRPRAVEAGAIQVALSDGVRAREGHDLLVAEALWGEDLPKVINLLVAVREAAHLRFHGVGGGLGILAAEASLDVRASHLLNCHVGSQGPKIRMSDGVWNVLLSDGLQQAKSNIRESCIGAEGALSTIGESHGGIRAATLQFAIREHAGIVP